jgi:hypothetical protein
MPHIRLHHPPIPRAMKASVDVAHRADPRTDMRRVKVR